MIPDMHGGRMCNVVDPIDMIEGISLETMHQNLYEGNLVAVGIERVKSGQVRLRVGLVFCARRNGNACVDTKSPMSITVTLSYNTTSQKTDYPNDIPQCGTDALRLALCA
ncbi:hypothetical protein BC938DRAFT_477167 [Jimgerdemannia flammicorona]|uniref:valine--tRNA ligase n=1 Tax=Jimgerdemannia flammicorona TaxID=994334 RepID=A0A433PBH6_9FUNG|nr:hypothetical protein BC938DRAFT_477167 [Jimgerdemannia flammicorona]